MIRIYLVPQIGSGTMLDPWRSKLHNYVLSSEYFAEWNNQSRHISICLLDASQETHNAIFADAQITLLSKLYNNKTEMKVGLDQTLDQFSPQALTNIQTMFESIGVNAEWVTTSFTLRDLLRYAIRIIYLAQISSRIPGDKFLDLLLQDLNATISSLAQAIRLRMIEWFDNNGLDRTWIIGTTLVRQVLKYIINNYQFPVIKLFYSEEDF